MSKEIKFSNIKIYYFAWAADIIKKLDKYLSVLEVVRLACNVFEVLNDDLTINVLS